MTGKRKAGRGKGGNHSGDLRALLLDRMEACSTAEALNDQVILPFVAALEDVCRARGYVMNIYGEQSNLVFTGDEDAAEEIYALVEAVLAARAESAEVGDDDLV